MITSSERHSDLHCWVISSEAKSHDAVVVGGGMLMQRSMAPLRPQGTWPVRYSHVSKAPETSSGNSTLQST